MPVTAPRRRSLIAAAAALASIGVVGCSSRSYPASPVPVHLTEREAASLANDHLDNRGVAQRMMTHFEPTERGTLFHYTTDFDATSRPPRQVRLVNVDNDGTVRETWFGGRD